MNKFTKIAMLALVFSALAVAAPSYASHDSYGDYGYDYGYYDNYDYGYDDYYSDDCYNCGYGDYDYSDYGYGNYDYGYSSYSCGTGGCSNSTPVFTLPSQPSVYTSNVNTNTNTNNNNININTNSQQVIPVTPIIQPPIIISQTPLIPTLTNSYYADKYFTQYVYVGETLRFNISTLNGDAGIERYALSTPAGSTFESYSGAFTWTPQYVGTHYAKFRVFRGNQYSNIYVTIIVQSRPLPITPIINFPSCTGTAVSAKEGQVYTYTVQATHSHGKTLTYSLVGPQGMQINPNFGTIIWVPNYSQGGNTYQITVTASDGAFQASCNFSIFVQDAHQVTPTPPQKPKPPVVTPPPAKCVCQCDCQEVKDPCQVKNDACNCNQANLEPEKETDKADTDNTDKNLLLASFLTLIGALFNPWLLLLVIVILAVLVYRNYKRRQLDLQLKQMEANAAKAALLALQRKGASDKDDNLPIIE